MSSSVLLTTNLPAFDRKTGQLTLAAHHLVSAPLSFVDLTPPGFTLLFDTPPDQPYQQQVSECSEEHEPPRRKRRRIAPVSAELASPAHFRALQEKRARQTSTDHESDQHHAGIVLDLRAAVEAVQQGWAERARADGWIGQLGASRVEWRDRNARDERDELELVGLAAALQEEESERGPLRLDAQHAQLSVTQLLRRLVLNDSADETLSVEVTLDAAECAATSAAAPSIALMLPPSSGFLMSDFSTWSAPSSGLASLGQLKGGWDVVIIDPPWPNASAARSASYETFDAYDLWKLDLPALLGDQPALVVVWLTNRVKFRRLVKDKLFPSWRVRGAAEWWWVKIASAAGEPVWPLDATHRRCYEGLVIGHYIPSGTKKVTVPDLPEGKVFLSAPIGHSRKPVIFGKPARGPHVLELFARMALAGPRAPANEADVPLAEAGAAARPASRRGFYLAVGNEAVKFNVMERPGDTRRGWVRRERMPSTEEKREAEGAVLAADGVQKSELGEAEAEGRKGQEEQSG